MTTDPSRPPPASITDDPRWARIVARDRTADGQFWYSVSTTGVYCRPSCPSRLARPEHVRLHDTLASARASGCRPCLRCHPDEPAADSRHAELIARACRLLAAQDEAPPLAALAAQLGLSPGHLHRLFKAQTGLTPKAYASAQRAEKLRAALPQADSVTSAAYAAGFNSSGRFYEQSTALLGMTPSRYRAGGEREAIRFAIGQSALGAILVASSAHGVVAILLGDDPEALLRELQDRFSRAQLIGADAAYETLVAQVVALVEAPGLGHALPLDVRGTAFQQRVWQALRQIPAGQTVSYSELAARIGQPRAVRAVASACAANSLAVAIPCHRVVRTDGALAGYAWGIDRKRELLAREAGTGTTAER
ncbi:bifunctional DNA-binding transcriptional regulator/O6-methylguanine-DNA methyltransferase Ada [Chitinilyticum litopenaei]|uniref:bifunctional DNA-binding transcriptional regulator/O6-methylguanine-DNA methyltransferase Ada n=1 Tax=Chitinilyticum litopenaei TaxID=1121276 RepID=UPI000422E918|nr:bifunctional DNA-binding transcriptional regulator/O6-methylguanine-DNA methyltransferase Ada [Chitinilyticum litopenaei]